MRAIQTDEQAKDFIKGSQDEDLMNWFIGVNGYYNCPNIAHVISCLHSLVADLFGIASAGSFVKALISNNLTEAILQADDMNMKSLNLYVAFMYELVPGGMLKGRR